MKLKNEQYNYCEKVDEALGNSYSKHRTLRTCVDPGSQEWSECTMEERVEVLKKVVKAGNDLEDIFRNYKKTYRDMNKPHVADNLEAGLFHVLEYLLKKETT